MYTGGLDVLESVYPHLGGAAVCPVPNPISYAVSGCRDTLGRKSTVDVRKRSEAARNG
jgi:hypothetical protein